MRPDDRFIRWATADLAKTSGIPLDEARRIIIATYIGDRSDRAEAETFR